jgi:putative ATP-binding cassette transporter
MKKHYSLIILYSIIGIISGLSGFLFIALVNQVIDLSISQSMPKEHNYFLYFSLTILLFFLSRRLLSEGIVKYAQFIFWSLRKNIIKNTIKAPYTRVRDLKNEIYSALTTDVNDITNASLIIIVFTSSIILVITCFIYLWYLSSLLFLISITGIALGILIYLRNAKIGNENFKIVRELEQNFMGLFNSVLDGIKEIKVNPEIGSSLFNSRLNPLIEEAQGRNVNAFIGYLNSQLLSQMLFYCIITAILIPVASYFNINFGTVVSFVFALLYLLGPIVTIMLNIPVLNKALISYRKLKYLNQALKDPTQYEDTSLPVLNEDETFHVINFTNYSYTHKDGGFSVGPIDFNIKANEIIFIYGGNGSGKTTFIRTLLHLYTPDKGHITVNNKLLSKDRLQEARSLFSPVFSDFYLFNELFGIENLNYEKVNSLLTLFELQDKVKIKNGKFSTTDMSTGQRKRLALIVAILEERPILVLDEWAADQDPNFRKKFYTEIIHKIREQENKTIIAITHDDKYYEEADRLFEMNYGRLFEITNNTEKIIIDK